MSAAVADVLPQGSQPVDIAALRRLVQQATNGTARAGALRQLEPVLTDPKLAAEAWCLTGRLRRDDGDVGGAIEAFRQGSEVAAARGLPLPGWQPLEYGRLLVQTGQHKAAEKLYRETITRVGDKVSPSLLGALAHTVLKATPDAPDIEVVMRRAILALPQDRLLVEAWFDRLRRQGSTELALAWLEALQAETAAPLRGVLLALAEGYGSEEVRRRFATQLERIAEMSPYAECARAWQAIVDGEEPAQADARVVVDDHSRASEFLFQFLREPPRQLPLLPWEEDPSKAYEFLSHILLNSSSPAQAVPSDAEMEAALTAAGVQIGPLRAFLADFLQCGTPQWCDILANAEIREPAARAAFEHAERMSGFLDRMVAEGTLRMMDPLTGEIVEPFDSVILFGRTIYSFRGKELFILVAGGPSSGACGLHIPRLNLSLPFRRAPGRLLGKHLPNTLGGLLKRAAARTVEGGALQMAPCAGRRELVLSVGGTDSFAHQFWNFYSAIERLVLTGQIGGISRVLFSGTEFFGPLDELFPELKSIGVEAPRRNGIVDPVPFRSDALVLPAGGFFIPRRLSQRVIDAMRRRPRTRETALEPADVPRKTGAPVVWMGMRLRDKAWVNQEAGSVRIIEILSRRFPDALFLIDGFSFPVGRDQTSDQWTDVIVELTAMGDRIRAASGLPNQVVNMVGNTLRESVLWAQETDVYLAPYGTTQHKIGWFTSAPGLVYVPPCFPPELVARSPACSAAEMGALPNFIFAEGVSPGERRGTNRGRERLANVSLDAEAVADQLTALLQERGKQPVVA